MPKKYFIPPGLSTEDLSAKLLKAYGELQETNEKLIQEERTRTEMFANISHDLRSPITAIRNGIEYLSSADSIAPEELDTTLHLLHRKVLNLESLINDIFLLTTVENTNIPFHFEQLDLGIYLEEFFFSCEADQKFSKRHLILDVPEHFPCIVSIDADRFNRVLDNLFTNALKYSNENASITLSAAISTDKKNAIVSVKDTGIGIPADSISKIFERSYTVSSARTPGSSGTGLGLSIAKIIMERLHGKIWCESKEGSGSTFYLSLPVISSQMLQ